MFSRLLVIANKEGWTVLPVNSAFMHVEARTILTYERNQSGNFC